VKKEGQEGPSFAWKKKKGSLSFTNTTSFHAVGGGESLSPGGSGKAPVTQHTKTRRARAQLPTNDAKKRTMHLPSLSVHSYLIGKNTGRERDQAATRQQTVARNPKTLLYEKETDAAIVQTRISSEPTPQRLGSGPRKKARKRDRRTNERAKMKGQKKMENWAKKIIWIQSRRSAGQPFRRPPRKHHTFGASVFNTLSKTEGKRVLSGGELAHSKTAKERGEQEI